jgi:predicted MFS family arabinose efflux permease
MIASTPPEQSLGRDWSFFKPPSYLLNYIASLLKKTSTMTGFIYIYKRIDVWEVNFLVRLLLCIK